MELIFLAIALWQFVPNDSCKVELAPPASVEYLKITGNNKIISYDRHVSCKEFNKQLQDANSGR